MRYLTYRQLHLLWCRPSSPFRSKAKSNLLLVLFQSLKKNNLVSLPPSRTSLLCPSLCAYVCTCMDNLLVDSLQQVLLFCVPLFSGMILCLMGLNGTLFSPDSAATSSMGGAAVGIAVTYGLWFAYHSLFELMNPLASALLAKHVTEKLGTLHLSPLAPVLSLQHMAERPAYVNEEEGLLSSPSTTSSSLHESSDDAASVTTTLIRIPPTRQCLVLPVS